jgi:hypothetical protein
LEKRNWKSRRCNYLRSTGHVELGACTWTNLVNWKSRWRRDLDDGGEAPHLPRIGFRVKPDGFTGRQAPTRDSLFTTSPHLTLFPQSICIPHTEDDAMTTTYRPPPTRPRLSSPGSTCVQSLSRVESPLQNQASRRLFQANTRLPSPHSVSRSSAEPASFVLPFLHSTTQPPAVTLLSDLSRTRRAIVETRWVAALYHLFARTRA